MSPQTLAQPRTFHPLTLASTFFFRSFNLSCTSVSTTCAPKRVATHLNFPRIYQYFRKKKSFKHAENSLYVFPPKELYPTKPQPAPSSTTLLPWRLSLPWSTALSKNLARTTPLSHITAPVTPRVLFKTNKQR